jgi:tellurite resistance protein
MQALVTAGALVALADGELEAVERDELVNFIDQQGFAPTNSPRDIADAFDSRVRELQDRRCAKLIVNSLRPLAGQSLASVLVRTAERVAAADGKIHPGEFRALKLIRQIMMNLPTGRPGIGKTTITSLRSSTECHQCGAVLISPEWWESVGPQSTVAIWRCQICGSEFGTIEEGVEKRLSQAEIVRAFFPSLLMA